MCSSPSSRRGWPERRRSPSVSSRRTDPLPLREHLRQRGSLGTFIDEPEHEEALGWALFGFPILLVGCMAMGWLIGPRRRIVRGKPIVVAAVLYLATAAWALLQVAPLL
jgi:hypothetical protein